MDFQDILAMLVPSEIFEDFLGNSKVARDEFSEKA